MKEPPRHDPWLRPAALLAIGLPLAGALAGCGGSEAEPVARLAVEPTSLELPYGSFADLHFRWTPTRELEGLEGSPRVFVHLLDSEGDLVRTFDHDPAGSWRLGQELGYETRTYQSLLAPPLPPGAYALTVGLYDPADGERWALETASEEVGRSEYRVATVEVPSGVGGGAQVPAVQFGPAWSPTLAGGDRQVVAFRWLSEEGTLRVEELSAAGTLWLSIGIPAEVAGRMRRRTLDPDAAGGEVPRVGLSASCSGFEVQLSGEGTHGVEVPLEPTPEGCEITVTPSYVMESPDGDERSLILEILAWRAAGG